MNVIGGVVIFDVTLLGYDYDQNKYIAKNYF